MNEPADDLLTDAALDRALDEALGVQPSPEFLARVRIRIADEPAPRAAWIGSVWALRGAIATGSAAALTAIALGTVVSRAPARSTSKRALASRPWSIASNVVAAPSAAGKDPPSRADRPIPTGPALRREAPAAEVLVAAAESQALRDLFASASEGRVALPVGQANATDVMDLPPILEISIPPIMIEPLALAGREEGVRL